MAAHTIIFSTNRIDDCAIDRQAHLKEALGRPLSLPDLLHDAIREADRIDDVADNLISLFTLLRDDYTQPADWQIFSFSSANEDNDLTGDISAYVFYTGGDVFWSRDCFAVIDADVYRINDCLGDTGLVDWTLGYWLRPLDGSAPCKELERLNNRVCRGYSDWPYGELENALYHPPVWSAERGCYVARPHNVPFVCRVDVYGPSYS